MLRAFSLGNGTKGFTREKEFTFSPRSRYPSWNFGSYLILPSANRRRVAVASRSTSSMMMILVTIFSLLFSLEGQLSRANWWNDFSWYARSCERYVLKTNREFKSAFTVQRTNWILVRRERVYLGLVVCFSLKNCAKVWGQICGGFLLAWTNFSQKITKWKRRQNLSQRTKTLFAYSFRRRKKTTAANTTAENML